MIYPDFSTRKELYDWLVNNKQSVFTQKKSVIKHGDGVPNIAGMPVISEKQETNSDKRIVKAVINTTLLLDSHDDVHMDGIWNKSLKERRYTILNQEHKHTFEAIISEGEDVDVSVEEYTWKELGFNFKGKTQGLTYKALIEPETNPMMYKRYIQGKVRQHSVEMMYVKMAMAINDKDYKEEYAEWEKVYPLIANKDQADERGYFFSIYEAKHLGGAAVPLGSNHATPTIDITEPDKSTPQNTKPPAGTPKTNLLFLT